MAERDDAEEAEHTRLSSRRAVPSPLDATAPRRAEPTEPEPTEPEPTEPELEHTALSQRPGSRGAPRPTRLPEPVSAAAPPAVYRPRAEPMRADSADERSPRPPSAGGAVDASAITARRRRTRIRTLVAVVLTGVLLVAAAVALLVALLAS